MRTMDHGETSWIQRGMGVEWTMQDIVTLFMNGCNIVPLVLK